MPVGSPITMPFRTLYDAGWLFLSCVPRDGRLINQSACHHPRGHYERRPDPRRRPPACPTIFHCPQVVSQKRLYGASEVTNRPSNSCASAAASASSHSRNAISLGRLFVAFGQIIQNVFDSGSARERPHQATIEQVCGGKSRASERNSLTLDRRVDEHTGMIENGTGQRSRA